jgi:hypothetical protein
MRAYRRSHGEPLPTYIAELFYFRRARLLDGFNCLVQVIPAARPDALIQGISGIASVGEGNRPNGA